MKTKFAFLGVPAICFGCALAAAAQNPAPAVPDRIVVTVDTQQTAEPVSKYLFGMFIEHLRTLIYRSLWSEMIDDRKFYFPISSKEPDAPAPAAGGPPRNMQLRKWLPVGPGEAVVMDKDQPFVGDQSPRIELDGASPRGIRQSGFALVKGKKYAGRIYLRGAAGSKVKVSLIWGEGDQGRQTISIGALTNECKKFALNFTSPADADAASLEITGTGAGNFHVGAVSLMPADNIQGFRPDTIALLRDLHSGIWRLPGGNFLSNWSWYDSVGDIDKRPPMFDYAWNAMQTNDVGMDELMTFCKLIGTEPYITVNAGFGDAHSAAEEVEYMNGPVTSRLGALRAHNGHPEPYHVKFWDIGNEPYGEWQIGRTDLRYFALKTNEFARAMRKADPSITLLASGAMPDEMTVTGQARRLHMPDPQAQFGSPADFTGGLLAHSWGSFDGLTEHWYARAGKRFDYEHAKTLAPDAPNEAGYVNVDQTLLEWASYPSNRVREKAEAWQEYEKRFPAMADKKIFLSIDEYAYSGAPVNLKSALAYGMVFNEMLRYTGFLKMSAFTMGVSTLDYNQTGAAYNTTGLLFKMYHDHLGSVPVALSGNSPQPAPKYPIAGDQPKTNPGSPTYPLDMFAALTADGKCLTVAVVNATESEQKFDLNVTGARIAGSSTLWQMTGSNTDAANRLGQPPQVEVKEIPIGNAAGAISVAPISVNIYRFPVAQVQHE
jgi:alpha-N-arabinofuranosidase